MAGETTTTDTATTTADTTAAVTRPDWLPETYWDGEKNAPKVEDLTKTFGEVDSLRALKTEQETRAASLPKSAADYKIQLPKDMKLPEGMQFVADPKDPLAQKAQALALELGLGQDGMDKLTGMWTGLLLETQKADAEATKAEMTALGTNAQARVDAAKKWADANLGAHAAALTSLTKTKAGVEALEAIQAAMSGVKLRGDTAANGKDVIGADLADKLGQQGTGRKLLEAAAAAKH